VRIRVRFYAELADLAGDAEVAAPFGEPRSVKDLIEALGVPHPEVALVVVDDEPVGFDHLLTGGEHVAVFPPFHGIDLDGVTTVAPPPIEPRFVLDVHLGTLTRRLRLLGFDCWYRTDADDDELAAVAVEDDRILLTRDRGAPDAPGHNPRLLPPLRRPGAPGARGDPPLRPRRPRWPR
jgi:uncharacterized protein